MACCFGSLVPSGSFVVPFLSLFGLLTEDENMKPTKELDVFLGGVRPTHKSRNLKPLPRTPSKQGSKY